MLDIQQGINSPSRRVELVVPWLTECPDFSQPAAVGTHTDCPVVVVVVDVVVVLWSLTHKEENKNSTAYETVVDRRPRQQQPAEALVTGGGSRQKVHKKVLREL